MEVRDAGENYTTSLRSWNCTPFCRIRGILPRRAGQNLPPIILADIINGDLNAFTINENRKALIRYYHQQRSGGLQPPRRERIRLIF